jgi:hypothetical protein
MLYRPDNLQPALLTNLSGFVGAALGDRSSDTDQVGCTQAGLAGHP